MKKAQAGIRWLFLLIAAALLSVEAGPLHAQPIRVVATTPDLADMAREIGKELVSVESLARGVENIHAVPVRPSFVPRLNRADVLVVMGLDYEAHWLPALLEVASNPLILPRAPGHIDVSVGIAVAEAATLVDRSEGDVHPKGNPHFNLDPMNGRTMARNIAEGLGRNFPQHQAAFQKNLDAYLAELERWIARWRDMAAPLQGVKIVTYHRDWTYFADRFGMKQIGTIELRPGIEPTPNHLVNLAAQMKREKVDVIIYGAQSDRIPRQLASETGARALRLPVMAGGSAETDSYIRFVDYNIRTLVQAVRGG